MEMKRVEELIRKQDDLKVELRRTQHELTDEVLNFEGSLEDALKAGLVRLNFSAPPGFYRHIRNI